MEELGFEQTEETLDHAVIITITLAGHALRDAIFLERSLITFHLVVPTLVRMQDQRTVAGDFSEGLSQHVHHQLEVGGLR